MNGSINWQVQKIYSGIKQIGISKHQEKAVARAEGAKTWHQIGQKLGIFSFKTADAYRAVWRNAMEYAKSNFEIRDIEKLTAREIQGYLQSKIDQNVARSTLAQYSSALEKLAVALNLYSNVHDRGKTYDFQIAAYNIKGVENLHKFDENRAYSDPKAIVDQLQDEKYKLVAKLQYQVGLRIRETNMIRSSQLLADNKLRVEGGKGGLIRIVSLPADIYQELKAAVAAGTGRFEFDKRAYARELKKAANDSGQKWQGTHGLRWSYAQNRFASLQGKGGKSYTAAEYIVSHELGHQRPDITEHYLGR